MADEQQNKTCPKCFKKLPNILFASHIKSTHYFCNTCMCWFSTLKSLKEHTNNCKEDSDIAKVNKEVYKEVNKENTGDEKNETLITNTEVDKDFDDQDNLLDLLKSYHCEFCKKSFKNKYFLKKHLVQEEHTAAHESLVKVKKDLRPFIGERSTFLCPSCKLFFKSLQSLKEHSLSCKEVQKWKAKVKGRSKG